MGNSSKIAQLGILHILNQMKNPLTNIRLSIDMLEKESYENKADCVDIIKNSAISLENSIRDLCQSFDDLGVSIHIEMDSMPFKEDQKLSNL